MLLSGLMMTRPFPVDKCHCQLKSRGIWPGGPGGDGHVVRAAYVLEPGHQRPEVVADEAAAFAFLDVPVAQVADLAVTGDDDAFSHWSHLPAGRPR